MLYGIRRDLQDQLLREGYNVRIYVPYGKQWLFLLDAANGRTAGNLLFVASNLFRG